MTHPILSVKDQVVLITGAAGIIGSTLVKGFLEAGANVIAADIGDVPAPASGMNDVLRVRADITSSDDREELVKSGIDRFGQIDTLINSAAIDAKFDDSGIGAVNMSRFENYPEEALRQSIEVNVIGTIQLTQAVCKHMLSRKSGSIINIASTYSLVAPNQSLYDFGGDIRFKPIDYVASKSVIPNFTRYLATFYGKDGIRANTVVPHGISNNHSAAFHEKFGALSPMGRMSDREEILGIFLYLSSQASSYTTGSTITVDGGWTAW